MNGNQNGSPPPERAVALTYRSQWPGWIWAVPLAAVGIMAWLLVRALSARGIDVAVRFEDAAEMKVGSTHVLHRGLDVGTLTRLKLDADGFHVIAHFDMDKNMAPYLTTGSRFYLEGAHPSFADPASLGAIVSGPKIVLVAGRGTPTRRFEGRLGRAPDPLAVRVSYEISFDGSVGDLEAGAPVTLRGFKVGEVARTELVTDAATGKVSTPVVVVLDPTRFHIRGARAAADRDWGALMSTALDELVRHGLRARLVRTPPLIGGTAILLDMLPSEAQSTETLRAGDRYPRIPAAGGQAFDQLLAQASHVPIGEIAENVRVITERVRRLAGSPQLDASIRHLDAALTELDNTLHVAGPKVAPTLESAREAAESLRKTANEMETTVAAARSTMGAAPTSPNGNLQQSLRELTDAARAVRSLADYLDQHPESLLRGRSD